MITAHELGYRVGSKQAGLIGNVARGAVRGGILGGGIGSAYGAIRGPGDDETRLGNVLSAGSKGLLAGMLLGGGSAAYSSKDIDAARKLVAFNRELHKKVNLDKVVTK